MSRSLGGQALFALVLKNGMVHTAAKRCNLFAAESAKIIKSCGLTENYNLNLILTFYATSWQIF